jgi:hypothetical protein
MARYKHIDTSPRFLPVDLSRQLLPGTFEHALNHLLDHEMDLSSFDERFRNDDTGASAYPPAARTHRAAGIPNGWSRHQPQSPSLTNYRSLHLFMSRKAPKPACAGFKIVLRACLLVLTTAVWLPPSSRVPRQRSIASWPN